MNSTEKENRIKNDMESESESDSESPSKQFRWLFPLKKELYGKSGSKVIHPFINSKNYQDYTLLCNLVALQPYRAPFKERKAQQDKFVEACKKDPGENGLYPLSNLKQWKTIKIRIDGYLNIFESFNKSGVSSGDPLLDGKIFVASDCEEDGAAEEGEYRLAVLLFKAYNNLVDDYLKWKDEGEAQKEEDKKKDLITTMQSNILRQAALGQLANIDAKVSNKHSLNPQPKSTLEDEDDIQEVQVHSSKKRCKQSVDAGAAAGPIATMQNLTLHAASKAEAQKIREQRKFTEAGNKKKELELREHELALREQEVKIQKEQLELQKKSQEQQAEVMMSMMRMLANQQKK